MERPRGPRWTPPRWTCEPEAVLAEGVFYLSLVITLLIVGAAFVRAP